MNVSASFTVVTTRIRMAIPMATKGRALIAHHRTHHYCSLDSCSRRLSTNQQSRYASYRFPRRSFTTHDRTKKVDTHSQTQRQPTSLLAWYSQWLETHPLLTKGITSGAIAAAADVICQYLTPTEEVTDERESTTTTATTATAKAFTWDKERTLRFWILGTVWVAPVTHYWYHALSTRILPGARTTLRVFQRLIMDQFVMAPVFVCSFVSGLWLLEGQPVPTIWESLQEVAPDIIPANWTLWIPAQIINFSLIPLQYQVLYSNVVALLWNVYISYVSAAESQKTKELQQQQQQNDELAAVDTSSQ